MSRWKQFSKPYAQRIANRKKIPRGGNRIGLPARGSLFLFCFSFFFRCFSFYIAEYHFHLDHIYKDLLTAYLAEQGVSDEYGFGEDLGVGLCATDWAREETK